MAKGRKSPRKPLKKSPTKVTKKQLLDKKRQDKAEADERERLFNENLISAVCSRSFIYDRDDPDHDRKKMISRAWEDISQEVGRTASVCHTRWRSLRDTFKRKYADWKSSQSGDGQDEAAKPTWPWFESLLFLKDCNIPEKTVDSIALSEQLDAEQPEGTQSLEDPETVELITISDPIQTVSSVPTKKLKEKKERKDTSSADVVMDKLAKYIDSQTSSSTSTGTKSSSFAQYLELQMDSLCEEDLEDFQLSCMNSLQGIKRSRREKSATSGPNYQFEVIMND